jgi:asparagine synthase (glutamine-hydrolysing)
MFAIAIWDTQNQILTIALDAIGIKPIHYYADGNNFAFGSELKAMKSLVPKLSINHDTIPFFLHLGYISPPISIYENVWKFPTGRVTFPKNSTV